MLEILKSSASTVSLTIAARICIIIIGALAAFNHRVNLLFSTYNGMSGSLEKIYQFTVVHHCVTHSFLSLLSFFSFLCLVSHSFFISWWFVER